MDMRRIKRAVTIPSRRESVREWRKFIIFTLHKGQKISFRVLGRIFGVNKDTARNWVHEVEDWPKRKKELIIKEMGMLKQHHHDMDMYERSRGMRMSYDDNISSHKDEDSEDED